MRTDDIFEAMTDIDDRFIEAARPLEPIELYGADQVVPIKKAPRRALWKTAVPAAACAAAVLTTAAIGGRYLYTRSLSAASNPSASIELWYPEEAQYRISGSIVLNNFGACKNSNGTDNRFLDEEMYAKSYRALAEESDLIVAGTFIDDLHQTQDPDEIHVSESPEQFMDEYFKGGSYNYLHVERVLKGTTESSYVLIHQLASTHQNGGGEYIVHTNDYLSPMIKGDSWVYFLKKSEDGFYIPVNGPQGRYPMPGVINSGITFADNVSDSLDDFGAYHAAPEANRAEIYAELVNRLNRADKSKIEQIDVPSESFTTFIMPEFSDVDYFNVSRLGVTANIDVIMDSWDIFDIKEDETLENLFLTDLNGDGKRELCATINGKASRVAVRDYANGLYYTLGNELDCSLYGQNSYSLSIDTGTIYTNSEVNNEPVWIPEDNEVLVVRYTVRNSNDSHLTVKTEELTLDILKLDDTTPPLWEVPLLGNTEFTLRDFEGFKFETIRHDDDRTDFVIQDDTHSGVRLLRQVEAVYFCDLNGDGQREIILSEVEEKGCGVWVYDIMDDGELGRVRYPAEGNGRAVEQSGKLVLQTDSGTKDINYSKSDLQRVVTDRRSAWEGTPFKTGDSTNYGYYETRLDIDHSLTSLNEVFPGDDNYSMSIENGALVVLSGNETLLKTGKLEELYGITDVEKDCLLFVYKTESGGFDAFILTENNSSKLVHIDDLVDNNVVLTNNRDVSIDFKDGRGVSLISILTRIYK